MRHLIWDLLEVARMEAGTLVLAPEPTDLALLVGQARASFLEGRVDSGMDVDLSSDLPWVMVDRQRVFQLLDRLLSDTAGHSPQETVLR